MKAKNNFKSISVVFAGLQANYCARLILLQGLKTLRKLQRNGKDDELARHGSEETKRFRNQRTGKKKNTGNNSNRQL